MSKQKRYETREAIINRIDSVKELAQERSLEMEECKREADECFKASAKETDDRKSGALIIRAEQARLKERNLVRLNSRLTKKTASAQANTFCF